MITASHPTVDAQIPTRQHRARSAVARSSPHLTFAPIPASPPIFECPLAPLRSVWGMNLLVWACALTWWLTTAPTLLSIPA